MTSEVNKPFIPSVDLIDFFLFLSSQKVNESRVSSPQLGVGELHAFAGSC